MLSYSRAEYRYLERSVPHSIPDKRDGDQELPQDTVTTCCHEDQSPSHKHPLSQGAHHSVVFFQRIKLPVLLQVMLDLQEKGTVGGLVSLKKCI